MAQCYYWYNFPSIWKNRFNLRMPSAQYLVSSSTSYRRLCFPKTATHMHVCNCIYHPIYSTYNADRPALRGAVCVLTPHTWVDFCGFLGQENSAECCMILRPAKRWNVASIGSSPGTLGPGMDGPLVYYSGWESQLVPQLASSIYDQTYSKAWTLSLPAVFPAPWSRN